MAESSISAANQVTIFQKQTYLEHVRGGRFGPLTGNTINSPIQMNKDLQKHSIALVAKLSQAGVRGSSQLVGNEEPLSDFEFNFTPRHLRHAVVIDDEERERSAFDLFQEARPALMNWLMELKRDQIIQAFLAVQAGGTYFNYGGVEDSGATGSSPASAANLDTWNTNNQDRILYGSANSNLTAGDHTTSLGTIDTTNDKLDTDALTLLKRIAADADPLIRPIVINNDEPMFIYLTGKYGFRDLRENSTMQQANREARARGVDNPLFAGGDLLWDNILIKEVPDLDRFIDSTGSGIFDGAWGANITSTADDLRTAGNSSSRVAPGFLIGAQALLFGLGKQAQFKRRKEDDYDHLSGVALSAKHDIKKIFYNNKQHGIVTHFHSASLDA